MKQYELTYNQPQTYLELRKEGLVHQFEAVDDLDARFKAITFGVRQGADLASLVQVERREVTRFEGDRKKFQIINDGLKKLLEQGKYEIFKTLDEIYGNPESGHPSELRRELDDNGNVHRDLEIRPLSKNEIPRSKYSFDIIPEIKEKEVPRKPYPGHSSPDF